ncbi:hypothetical protein AB4156_02175 [Cupriavidus sp. 2MCAB6]|uniref:hypothetical protein n=1 Tax=Cupriavidus sp. 2MCAB6 TaxID=3232981 RepID=UPI003F8FB63A
MKRFVVGVAAAILCCAVPARAAGVQQAFLVQNSGWMEPFYADPASRLKPLVAAVAGAAASAEDKVYLLAFSQSTAGNASPALLSQGTGAADVARRLAPLAVARKGAGEALADTDFQEAVTKTITGPFKAAPGIIWIFTNNKNSPNNDAQTAERNRDFYRLLHLEPSITRTLAFPLKMPVQGKQYAAKGLMVYALAYGQPAADALGRIMAEGRLSKVLTRAPARLKPIDQDAVRIVPELVRNTPNVRASLGTDQRTIVLDVDAASLVPTVALQASLQNLFYPYVIRSAGVNATLGAGGQSVPVQVEPAAVKDLQPGASQPVQAQFALPMAQVPSPWSAQAMSAMGKQVLLPMTVEIGLAGQQLALSDGFAGEMRELFPGDPISEVFTPPESVRASVARVPLLVRIQYPLLPLLVAIGGLLALVLGAGALGLVSGRSKRYELLVDGVPRHVVLKPFARLVLKDDAGQPIGEVRRGLGKPQVRNAAEGHSLRFSGR